MIRRPSYIDALASIHPTAHVYENAWIGPNVQIGEHTVIGPGTVIGRPGFGYTWDENLGWVPKEHRHGVLIGAKVKVGANTVIDAGSWRPTRVDDGAKIDSLVFIAHNVVIGRDAMVVARAEISGSVVVHRGAWIGAGAVLKERIAIEKDALVGAGAVVIRDVRAGTTVAGNPARVIHEDRGAEVYRRAS